MAPKNIRLDVVGNRTIHCAGCENTIRRALQQLPGVRRVLPDRKTQRIGLILDVDQTPLSEIKEKLDWTGWTVQVNKGDTDV